METAGIFVNGAIVVIENDEDVAPAGAGIVQSLQCEAAGQGTVADDGDYFFVNASELCRIRHSQRSRYGSR